MILYINGKLSQDARRERYESPRKRSAYSCFYTICPKSRKLCLQVKEHIGHSIIQVPRRRALYLTLQDDTICSLERVSDREDLWR
jgi:hypothetical protein